MIFLILMSSTQESTNREQRSTGSSWKGLEKQIIHVERHTCHKEKKNFITILGIHDINVPSK